MIHPLKACTSLLYPEFCRHCGKRLDTERQFLCSECEKKLIYLENICQKCGSVLTSENCLVCADNHFYFDKARSLFPFTKVIQSLIHDLKYEEITKVANLLCKYICNYMEKYQIFQDTDIIAPVPLHRVKKRSRGYNQSEKLSRQLAKNLKIKHLPDLLKRNRFTDTQTKLTRQQRYKNVAEAFILNTKYRIKRKNILLIDDVFTTGSTVNSISKVLKNSQVSKIYVLTIARA